MRTVLGECCEHAREAGRSKACLDHRPIVEPLDYVAPSLLGKCHGIHLLSIEPNTISSNPLRCNRSRTPLTPHAILLMTVLCERLDKQAFLRAARKGAPKAIVPKRLCSTIILRFSSLRSARSSTSRAPSDHDTQSSFLILFFILSESSRSRSWCDYCPGLEEKDRKEEERTQ